ncbi:MAG TPA: VOC family protein [Nitrososphaera sp.]|nr:VOC family protein [Nitrososphaera sp.]
MNRPSHFDISADDPKRAIKFYEDIFGWKFKKWDGPMEYWMVKTGPKKEPGINGGLSKRGKQGMPSMNTIEVASLDKISKKIENKGGKVVMPKTVIPGVGWFATVQDTEGNTFGIIQEDKKAK